MSTPTTRTNSKKTKSEPFSLVPRAVQRHFYELTLRAQLIRQHLGSEKETHTDFAEIGAAAALHSTDLVFPSDSSIGLRLARQLDVHQPRLSQSSSLAATLGDVVTQLVDDPKRFAIVSTERVDADPSWRPVLRFAGQHKLPILFVVAGLVLPRREKSTDLRTIYAEYGVPVIDIDANDPIAAFRASTEAAHNARVGRGPTVLQASQIRLGSDSLDSHSPLKVLESYMRLHNAWDEQWLQQTTVAASEHLDTFRKQTA